MAKSKSRARSNKPVYIILLVSVLVSLVYVGFKYMYPPQSTQIMEIAPVALEYGYTTISGTLIKDAPIGQKGAYLLTLSDMRVVYLTVEGIDSLVGQKVLVTGVLAPSDQISKPMIMVVSKIESI